MSKLQEFIRKHGTDMPATLVREAVVRAHCGGLTPELEKQVSDMLDELQEALREEAER